MAFTGLLFVLVATCAATIGQACVDTNNNRLNCLVYSSYPQWCGTMDDSYFSANEMCCACGGGVQAPTTTTEAPTTTTEAPTTTTEAPTTTTKAPTTETTTETTEAPTTTTEAPTTTTEAPTTTTEAPTTTTEAPTTTTEAPTTTMEAPTTTTEAPTTTTKVPTTETTTETTEACVDTDNGARDDADDACADYRSVWCGNHDDSDFTSNEMCCACGGGGAVQAPTTTTEAPTTTTEAPTTTTEAPTTTTEAPTTTTEAPTTTTKVPTTETTTETTEAPTTTTEALTTTTTEACHCNDHANTDTGIGRADCATKDSKGVPWCYVNPRSCSDGLNSKDQYVGGVLQQWSFMACEAVARTTTITDGSATTTDVPTTTTEAPTPEPPTTITESPTTTTESPTTTTEASATVTVSVGSCSPGQQADGLVLEQSVTATLGNLITSGGRFELSCAELSPGAMGTAALICDAGSLSLQTACYPSNACSPSTSVAVRFGNESGYARPTNYILHDSQATVGCAGSFPGLLGNIKFLCLSGSIFADVNDCVESQCLASSKVALSQDFVDAPRDFASNEQFSSTCNEFSDFYEEGDVTFTCARGAWLLSSGSCTVKDAVPKENVVDTFSEISFFADAIEGVTMDEINEAINRPSAKEAWTNSIAVSLDVSPDSVHVQSIVALTSQQDATSSTTQSPGSRRLGLAQMEISVAYIVRNKEEMLKAPDQQTLITNMTNLGVEGSDEWTTFVSNLQTHLQNARTAEADATFATSVSTIIVDMSGPHVRMPTVTTLSIPIVLATTTVASNSSTSTVASNSTVASSDSSQESKWVLIVVIVFGSISCLFVLVVAVVFILKRSVESSASHLDRLPDVESNVAGNSDSMFRSWSVSKSNFSKFDDSKEAISMDVIQTTPRNALDDEIADEVVRSDASI